MPFFTTELVREVERVSHDANTYSNELFAAIERLRRVVGALLSIHFATHAPPPAPGMGVTTNTTTTGAGAGIGAVVGSFGGAGVGKVGGAVKSERPGGRSCGAPLGEDLAAMITNLNNSHGSGKKRRRRMDNMEEPTVAGTGGVMPQAGRDATQAIGELRSPLPLSLPHADQVPKLMSPSHAVGNASGSGSGSSTAVAAGVAFVPQQMEMNEINFDEVAMDETNGSGSGSSGGVPGAAAAATSGDGKFPPVEAQTASLPLLQKLAMMLQNAKKGTTGTA